MSKNNNRVSELLRGAVVEAVYDCPAQDGRLRLRLSKAGDSQRIEMTIFDGVLETVDKPDDARSYVYRRIADNAPINRR
jgi:hypothetical protein